MVFLVARETAGAGTVEPLGILSKPPARRIELFRGNSIRRLQEPYAPGGLGKRNSVKYSLEVLLRGVRNALTKLQASGHPCCRRDKPRPQMIRRPHRVPRFAGNGVRRSERGHLCSELPHCVTVCGKCVRIGSPRVSRIWLPLQPWSRNRGRVRKEVFGLGVEVVSGSR